MPTVLDKEMSNYFTQLNEAEKRVLVQMLKSFLKTKQQQPNRISIAQYNKEIEMAMQEIAKGETYSHDEVVKMAKDW
jgi:hypothetical protein